MPASAVKRLLGLDGLAGKAQSQPRQPRRPRGFARRQHRALSFGQPTAAELAAIERRQLQQLDWFRSYLRQRLEHQFYNQAGMRERLATVEAQVKAGTLLPVQAVNGLIALPQ